ncbi:MAG TPA: rhodanese-like domain-containing protein [Noviherbaspirillum sp.]
MQTYDTNRANQYFRDKLAFTTGVHELEVMLSSPAPAPYQVVDVRYPTDFAASHVPKAVNLPRGKWDNPRGLSKETTLYLYCYNQTCHLAAEAAVALTALGYRVVEVEGGWAAWEANGYRVEAPALAAVN